MSPTRRHPCEQLATVDLLEAVAWLGIRWMQMFSTYEVSAVNEALDRELFAGNLLNAFTLSGPGHLLLDEERGTRPRGRLDLVEDAGCSEHLACFVISCSRCHRLRRDHVTPDSVDEVVRTVVTDHLCSRSPADSSFSR